MRSPTGSVSSWGRRQLDVKSEVSKQQRLAELAGGKTAALEL